MMVHLTKAARPRRTVIVLGILALLALAGALTVFRAEALPPVIDLNSTSAGLTVFGKAAGDYSGSAVAAGDINGDTIDDLIIGAHDADPAGRADAGETYVVYGGPSLPATIDLNGTSADLTVFGNEAGDLSGWSVAAGDIDGDTTDDLIIGARWAHPSGRLQAGETYVIYGGPSLPATIDLSITSAGLTVFGNEAGDLSGWSVAAGDIDGDTTDDLIIGAPGVDASRVGFCLWSSDRCNAGATYVIYGGPGLPAVIDLSSTSAGLTVLGEESMAYSGWSVAAGDIDGDTTDDLIIGAPGGPFPATRGGKTYVIYGGPSLPATIDLDSSSADLTVLATDDHDRSGLSVTAGDVNGDGADDLIIGAPSADGSGSGTACPLGGVGDRCEAGESYVIYGGPSLPATIDVNNATAGLTVYGDDPEDYSGSAVAAGDTDGDGTEDLIIGAPAAEQAGDSTTGGTYVIYGGSALSATIDLDSASADLTVFGDDPGDGSGTAVAAGDIDGDTIDDLIIGAEWAGPAGGLYVGETYVIYGEPRPIPSPTPTPTAKPTPDEEINIHVNRLSSGAKVDGTCWNVGLADKTVLGVVCDGGTGDGDPADGLLRIIITSDQRVQFGNIWHVWMESSPVEPLDGNNYVCDLSQGKCNVPKVAVGGLQTALDPTGSGGNAGPLSGIAAVLAAGAVALGGAAWYARRHAR